VVYALKELYSRVADRNPHMREMIRIELDSLENVVLEFNDGTMKWEKGVLSGYLFTALVDSILNRAETRVVLERMGRDDVSFERYQGDDAILNLVNWIDRERVAREYQKLGLEIHPLKTWVTTESTEYLHEIYFKNGGVYGFPARSFRAIAWSKPVTGLGGEFGAQKTNALLDSLRMCCRRGLVVEEIARRVIKGILPDFDETKFQAWLKTPVCMAGFGGGMTGRVSLNVHSKRIKSFNVSVQGLGTQDKLWQQAIETRVASACPIPGIRNTYSLNRVRGNSSMPKMKVSQFADAPVLRIDWEVSDLETFPDAYRRKLLLEWKLVNAEEVLKEDLPEGFLMLEKVDRAYRRYRKLVGMVLSTDSAKTAAESFVRIGDWVNHAWAGISLDWAFGEFESWEKLHHQLVRTLVGMMCEVRGDVVAIRV
jgi:hypothetical protein